MNHELLQDSHWIGGDPLESRQAYGFASWKHSTPTHPQEKFALLLRNPNPTPLISTLTLLNALELPQFGNSGDSAKSFKITHVYGPGLDLVLGDARCSVLCDLCFVCAR
jgi:hypothetical protein